MTFLEPNSLIDNKKKIITISDGIRDYYNIWKEMRKEYGENSELESFMIGYMIGNNLILREKFIKMVRVDRNKKKDIFAKVKLVNR